MSKTLFLLRCYSGFEESLIMREWYPSGATTIVKILEYVQNHEQIRILFVSNSHNIDIHSIKSKKIILKNFKIPIYLIKTNIFIGKKNVLGKLYREIYNIFSIVYHLLKFKPKTIYTDHANIFVAAFVSRFTKIKTVIRLMGVKDDMRECLNGNSIYNKILRWSYKSPFSMVIATQDGAGAEVWMNKALLPNVSRKTILNGVDKIEKVKSIRINDDIFNKFTLVFMGRLEHDKAPDKFVEAFLLLKKKLPNLFHAIIIGSGSMKKKLDQLIEREDAGNEISFFSNLNKNSIHYLLNKADIYVSLNRNGNLSNSNIEAMVAGKAMIIPKSNSNIGIDVYTDSIIKENAVIRIKNSDSIEEVVNAVVYLFKNKNQIKKLQRNILKISDNYIESWDKRIKWEFNLLNIIAANNQENLNNYLRKK